MTRELRSGKKGHRRIGENETNSCPTWSKITRESSPKRGGTKMGKEGYGIAMHAAEDLTNGYLLREVVTNYSEV